MNLRFTNWYTQALGGTLGIAACLYSYLNGDMIIYSNINTYFDTLGFGSLLSSYLLLPLCIITLLLAVIRSYASNKEVFNVPLENINIVIIISTVIIGFMGAKIYFCIPAIFILFNLLTYYKMNKLCNKEDGNIKEKEIKTFNYDSKKYKTNKLIIKKQNTIVFDEAQLDKDTLIDEEIVSNNQNDSDPLKIKIEMAKELLEKNAQKQFIMELTGLTSEELYNVEDELKKS